MALVMTSTVPFLLVLCAQEAAGFSVFFAGQGSYNGCSKPVAVGTTVMGRQTIAETTYVRPVGFQRDGAPVACGGTFKRGESLTAHIAPTEKGGTYNSRQEFVFALTGGSFASGACDGSRIADTDEADLRAPDDNSVLTLVAAWPDLEYDVSMFPQLRITSVCNLYPEPTTTPVITTTTPVTTTIVTTTPVITTTTPVTTTIAIKTAPITSTSQPASPSSSAPSTTEPVTTIETSRVTEAAITTPVVTTPIVQPVATDPLTTASPSTGAAVLTSAVASGGSEAEAEDEEDITSGTCRNGQLVLASMALVIMNICALTE